MMLCLFVVGCVAASGQGYAPAEARGMRLDSAAAKVMTAPLSHPVRVTAGGVRLEWRGLYMCRGLLWLSFCASNRSAIDFRADPVRVYVRDRRALRRRAQQELWLRPVFRKEEGVLGAGQTAGFCDALVPRVPAKDQELVVEWVERNGDRRLRMTVRGKWVLKAVRLN
jgi:hypothetical protein